MSARRPPARPGPPMESTCSAAPLPGPGWSQLSGSAMLLGHSCCHANLSAGHSPAHPSHAERYPDACFGGPGPWHLCALRLRYVLLSHLLRLPSLQASVLVSRPTRLVLGGRGEQTQALRPGCPLPSLGREHLSPSPCCLGPATGLSDPLGPQSLLEGSTTAPSLFPQKPSDGAGRLEARLAPDGAAHAQGSGRPPPAVSGRPAADPRPGLPAGATPARPEGVCGFKQGL